MSRANINQVILYAGTSVMASSSSSPLLTDGGIQTLTRPPAASNSFTTGFGAAMWAAGPVLGSGPSDLLLGYPLGATVSGYKDWGTSGALSGNASYTVNGPTNFGANINVGDLSGDGKMDLAVSEGNLFANGVWVLYQHSGAFDSPLGGSNIRFQVSQLRATFNTSTASSFGRGAAIADIDGVNGPDLIIGDDTTGIVTIWR
jgi:hypothetical protein